MSETVSEICQKPSRASWYEESAKRHLALEIAGLYRCSSKGGNWEQHSDWFCSTKLAYETDRRLARVFQWRKQRRTSLNPDQKRAFTAETERLRSEFTALAEQWRCETQHLSQVSKKVIHPNYLRIVGMGEAVVPLLLEALRDRPAHWFVALRSITNQDPVPLGANPAQAREAWLSWGRAKRFLN